MKYTPIPNFTRYGVSTSGKIRRLVWVHNLRPGPVRQRKCLRGYFKVNLTDDVGKHHTAIHVHRIVAETFLGPRPDGFHTCHNNGIKADNRLSNLRYDTPRANSQDSVRHGVMPRGERQHLAKLTEAKVREIHARLNREPQKQIAADYGVTYATIGQIQRGVGWKHLGLPRVKWVRKLSDADVAVIADGRAAGQTLNTLAERFNVSRPAIAYALKYRASRTT